MYPLCLIQVLNKHLLNKWITNFTGLYSLNICTAIKKNYLFFWLYWVFIAVWGVFLVAASGDYSPIVALGFSVLWLLFQSTVSIVVAHRLSCSIGCGIIQDQGSNQCLLHWQADSLPLSHQGSPFYYFLNLFKKKKKKHCVKSHISHPSIYLFWRVKSMPFHTFTMLYNHQFI